MPIIEATPLHANIIADAILMAVGTEICTDFAAPNHSLDDVQRLFASLALRPDSQYSYRNTLLAVTPSGDVAGVCIAYDGALLHSLRQRFFEAAETMLQRSMQGMADETSADEFYIDTLAVFPPYRRHGYAKALLRAQIQRAAAIGKPAGLLVDKQNPRAASLYHAVGFRYVDDRPFADVMMNHLQYLLPD